MKDRVSATGVATVVLSAVLVAQGPLVLDQESPADPGPIPFTHAVGGPNQQVISQTVTAGVSGRLRAVEVPMGCADGEVILEIRDVDAAGQPGPTLYFTDTYDVADFPSPVTDTFNRLRLNGMPVRFLAGDRFTISLGNPTGSCGIWPGPVGDPYPDGTGWAEGNDGPIVALSVGTDRDDIPFRTFVR